MNGKTDGRKLLTLSRLLPVRLPERKGSHIEWEGIANLLESGARISSGCVGMKQVRFCKKKDSNATDNVDSFNNFDNF